MGSGVAWVHCSWFSTSSTEIASPMRSPRTWRWACTRPHWRSRRPPPKWTVMIKPSLDSVLAARCKLWGKPGGGALGFLLLDFKLLYCVFRFFLFFCGLRMGKTTCRFYKPNKMIGEERRVSLHSEIAYVLFRIPNLNEEMLSASLLGCRDLEHCYNILGHR